RAPARRRGDDDDPRHPRDELRARSSEQGLLPRRGRDPRGRAAGADLLGAPRGADAGVPLARAGSGAAMSRLRGASKAPLAIAGTPAVPLFFVGLMAFSLKLDKPSVAGVRLADPTKGTVGTIYLAAFAVAGGLVLVGLLAMLLRSRLAAAIPAAAA